MDINEFKDILKGFFRQIVGSTYKDPLMVYDADALLGVVGNTVGVPKDTMELLESIINEAKETGKINNKKVKSLYKAIVETEGAVQPLSLILDRNLPVAERLSKLVELVYFPSYKGLYRNLFDSGKGTNYELNTRLQTTSLQGLIRRLPDGPTGFVPAYTNLAEAAHLIAEGVIAFQPYRKVVNTIEGQDKLNRSQSDMFIETGEEIAARSADKIILEEGVKMDAGSEKIKMKIINPSGEFDNFKMTLDKYSALSAILDVLLADQLLLEKYGWRDILDPAVAAEIDAASNGEVRKAFEEAKAKPKLDPKANALIQKLQAWKNALANTWFGNAPIIINSGQLGIEEEALRIYKNIEVEKNVSGSTGGFSPSGYVNSYLGKVNEERKELYNLQEIYKGVEGKPGDKIDTADILNYLDKNASPELKRYIGDLERMGWDDPMKTLANAWVGYKDMEGDTQRFWSEARGNAAELALAKQMNVNQADINVIAIRASKLDEVALKTAMYSVYGEWKLPEYVNILYLKDNGEFAEKSVWVKKEYVSNEVNLDRVADELRKASPQLKRNTEYWKAAAEKRLESLRSQFSNRQLNVNTSYVAGEQVKVDSKDIAKKHTIIIDIDTLRHTVLGEGLERIAEQLNGENKVIVRDGDRFKIVDKSTNQSSFFPVDKSTKIHVTGQTGPITPYQRDMLTKLLKSLVSPDLYLSQLAEPQIRKMNISSDKPNFSTNPISHPTFRVLNNEPIENIMKEGTPDFNNPNFVSEVGLIEQGKQNGFLIREADLLRKLNARNVKEALNILNKEPVMRLVNFKTGEEVFVDIQGYEKLENYKFKKQDFIEEFTRYVGDSTLVSFTKFYDEKNNVYIERQPQFYDFEKNIEYISNSSIDRYDERFKKKINKKPFWLLKVRVEPKSPLVERAKLIRSTLQQIGEAQTLADKYWSYGQDPKAITRQGKRNLPGKVYNLFLVSEPFEGIVTDLYKAITSYDIGPRDFDTNRLMHNLSNDVYKAESLQELVNALLAEPAEVTNAYKAINPEQLALARENNLLGKLGLFYKLMGRPNAILQAIALNISKELLSGNYNLDAELDKMKKAIQAIKTIDDIDVLPEALKNIIDSTNGNHSQHLTAKILEAMSSTLQEELAMHKKYPDLLRLYNYLAPIDKINADTAPPDEISTYTAPIEEDGELLDREIEMRDMQREVVEFLKDGEFYKLANELFKSYLGISSARMETHNTSLEELLNNSEKEIGKKYAKELEAYSGKRNRFDIYRRLSVWAKETIDILNGPEVDILDLPKETRLEAKETQIMRLTKNLLSNPKAMKEFVKTFEDVDLKGIRFNDVETIIKRFSPQYLDEIGLERQAVEALDSMLERWQQHYLATDYLRVDNLFGIDTEFKNMNGVDVHDPRPDFFGLDESTFSSLFFTEGYNNAFVSVPTALHALMLNDLNMNPAIQDNFINKLIKEYGDVLFTGQNLMMNMQTMAPLIAQQAYLAPEGFKYLIDEIYRLNDIEYVESVDFTDDKQVAKFLEDIGDITFDTKNVRDILPVIEKLMGTNISMLVQQNPDVLNLVIGANLYRLAIRPENFNKVLGDARKLEKGLPTWEQVKKLILESNSTRVLTGEGGTMNVPKETIEYLKKQTKDRIQALRLAYIETLPKNTNLKITIKNNIPKNWDMITTQNPFTVAPAFGADAFYHLEFDRKDKSISWKDTMGELEIGVIQHAMVIEQPNNYVNTFKTLGNEYSTVLRSGMMNSFLYSNSLSESIELDQINELIRTEADSFKSYIDQLERDAMKRVSKDPSKFAQVSESIKYLREMVYDLQMQAEVINNVRMREGSTQQGVRAFYGLEDAGSFPLAKVKFQGILSNPMDIAFFHSVILPLELTNKSLEVKDIADIQKKLLNDNVNFEVGQYLEALQDLTEGKLGRKNLEQALQLANEVNEIMFYGEKGILAPPEVEKKNFKFVNREQELYFRKLKHDWARGIDISKYPQVKGMPSPIAINEMLSGTYNKYEGPYLKDRLSESNRDSYKISGKGFKNAIEFTEDVKDKYSLIKDRKVKPELGPVDATNFKDFGAFMNLQLSRNYDLWNSVKGLSPQDQVSAYIEQNGVLDAINQRLTNPSQLIFNYTNGALQYDLGLPMLPSGKIPSDLATRGPLGWNIIEPPRAAIPMADGLNKILMPRQNALPPEPGMFFGEGDPFYNARVAPEARPVGGGRFESFIGSVNNKYQGLKNVAQFARVLGYSPAKYKWNFDQRVGREIQPYTKSKVQYELPGIANKPNGFKRYFQNLRTLEQLPYFYNRSTGKGAGRAYVFLMGDNPNAGYKAHTKVLPLKPGYELNAKDFENFYRQNKKAYLTKRAIQQPYNAYGKAVHYAFIADMLSTAFTYQQNAGDMSYQEFVESASTNPVNKAIHKIFTPITWLFERPYVYQQNVLKEKELAQDQFNKGEIDLKEYNKRMSALNYASDVIRGPIAVLDVIGKAFMGGKEMVGQVGVLTEVAKQRGAITADKFRGSTEEEWISNIQKTNRDLAKTRHLSYNYGEDLYNMGRRFMTRQQAKIARGINNKDEQVQEEVPEGYPDVDVWSQYGTIGLAAGSAGK